MALDQVDVDQIEDRAVKEMTFFDHLEELRMHILRALLGVVIAAILLFVFQKWFFAYIIFGPTHADFISYQAICDLSNWVGLGDRMCFSPPEFRKQAIGFGEAFITSIKVSIIGGIIAAFPYVFWEVWSFIRPGLYPEERRYTRGVVFICSFLFFLGVLFGYFIIAPFAVNFLAGYTIPGVENSPTLNSFINYMIMFTAPAGLIFELPVLVFFLTKIGLLSSDTMRTYRRHSIIVILLLSAIITPPDVITQFLIAIPLSVLYEISIWIAKRVERKEAEESLT